MSRTELKKIKKQIEKILEKVEDQALSEGVLISSIEFQNLLTELKTKLLAEYGLSVEDYDLLELELETKREIEDDDVVGLGKKLTEIGDKTKAQSDARKKEFKEKTDELVNNFNKEIQGLTSSFKSEIDNTKKSVLTRNDIVNIVRPLLPRIPKHGDVDHPKILKELNALSVKIGEIAAGDRGVEFKRDLLRMQSDFVDLYDKVKNIKIPSDYVPTSVLEPSVKEILGGELNRILRSFQSQVYAVNVAVQERVIRSGFYKLTVSATEPTNPSVNDLWCDIS